MYDVIPVDFALKAILNTLPDNRYRKENLDQVNQFLLKFLGYSTAQKDAIKSWSKVSSSVKHLLEVFRCYRKTVQVLGRIFQGYVQTYSFYTHLC